MILGVTGTIGCGKSTVARLFARKGYGLIDADKIGHKVLNIPSVRKKIKKTFGKEVFIGKKVSRSKLGKAVFSNQKNLKKLNRITHPHIGKIIQKELKNRKNVVLDAAVLIEAGWQRHVDRVVVVKTSYKEQIRRLIKQKRYPLGLIKNIIKAQMPLKKKLQYADFVIDNSGTLRKTSEQVNRLYQKWKE